MFEVVSFLANKLWQMPFYAVKVGRVTGVFNSWEECSSHVNGFPNARFKKFSTMQEAWHFVKEVNSSNESIDSAKRKTDCELPAEKKIKVLSVSHSSKNSFYAVFRGYKPGVYRTWTDCEAQIKGFKNPSYRKFSTEKEAIEFMKSGGIKKFSHNEAKRVPVNSFACNFGLNDNKGKEYTLEDVKVTNDEFITVFTDGASSKNGRVGAAAGIGVFWGPNHPLNTSMRLPGRQTNNRAEIYAATHALRQARTIGARNIKLYTDSQFLIHGITDWIHKWKKNGWRLATGDPVKNKDDFIELDDACEGLNVQFIYIKAHDNNPGNVEADRLAVQGARKELKDSFILLA